MQGNQLFAVQNDKDRVLKALECFEGLDVKFDGVDKVNVSYHGERIAIIISETNGKDLSDRSMSQEARDVFIISRVEKAKPSLGLNENIKKFLPVSRSEMYASTKKHQSLSGIRDQCFSSVKKELGHNGEESSPLVKAVNPNDLVVKRSPKGGVGLYAKREIKKGSAIAYYGSVVQTSKNISSMSPYLFKMNNGYELNPDLHSIIVFKICTFLDEEFSPKDESKFVAFKYGLELCEKIQLNTNLSAGPNSAPSLAAFANSCCTDRATMNFQPVSVKLTELDEDIYQRYKNGVVKISTSRSAILYVALRDVKSEEEIVISYGGVYDARVAQDVIDSGGFVVEKVVHSLDSSDGGGDSDGRSICEDSDLDGEMIIATGNEIKLAEPNSAKSAGNAGVGSGEGSDPGGDSCESLLLGLSEPPETVDGVYGGQAAPSVVANGVPTGQNGSQAAPLVVANGVATGQNGSQAAPLVVADGVATGQNGSQDAPLVVANGVPTGQNVSQAAPVMSDSQDLAYYAGDFNANKAALVKFSSYVDQFFSKYKGKDSLRCVDGARNRIFLWLMLNISRQVINFSHTFDLEMQRNIYRCVSKCFNLCVEHNCLSNDPNDPKDGFIDHVDGGHVWLSIYIGCRNGFEGKLSGFKRKRGRDSSGPSSMTGYPFEESFLYAIIIDLSCRCSLLSGIDSQMKEYLDGIPGVAVRKGCIVLPPCLAQAIPEAAEGHRKMLSNHCVLSQDGFKGISLLAGTIAKLRKLYASQGERHLSTLKTR